MLLLISTFVILSGCWLPRCGLDVELDLDMEPDRAAKVRGPEAGAVLGG